MRSLLIVALALWLGHTPAEAQSTTPPKLLEMPVRYYPRDAAEVAARVVLQFVVGVDGRAEVSTIAVLRTTDERFVEAARLTARELRFEPGRERNAPVKMLVQQAIDFAPRSEDCRVVVIPYHPPQCVDSLSSRAPS
jgi:outer membrane biosynthesis protein TonB